MKNLFLLLLLGLFHQSIAQNLDWKVIGFSDSTRAELLYVSNQGKLFAKMEITNEIIQSNDYGQSWEEIHDLAGHYIVGYHQNSGFKTDANDNIYLSTTDCLLKSDQQAIHWDTLIYSRSHDILDYHILANGNILILNLDALLLFDAQGNQLAMQALNYLVSDGAIFHDETGDDNYIFLTTFDNSIHYSLHAYSDDLSFLGNQVKIPEVQISNLIRKGNYFITDQWMSNDKGVSWNNLWVHGTNAFKILEGQGNRIYFLSTNALHYTDDFGTTFHQVSTPGNNYKNAFAAQDSSLLLTFDRDTSYFIHSKDLGENWNEIHVKKGLPHCTDIYANYNENLLSRSDYTAFLSKDSLSQDWLSTNHQNNGLFIKMVNIDVLPDSSVIGVDGTGRIYKSLDNGLQWEEKNLGLSTEIGPVNIKILGNTLYIFKGINIYRSEDFGEHFEMISSFNDESADALQSLYYYNWEFSNQEILYKETAFVEAIEFHDFTKNESGIISIPENLDVINFAVSKHSNTLYVLCLDSVDNYVFLETFNQGITFNKKTLPIQQYQSDVVYVILNDHNDNLYISNGIKIFVSYDLGLSWEDISPDFDAKDRINGLHVSFDNYLYLATTGKGVMKYMPQVKTKGKIVVNVYPDINNNCVKDPGEEGIANVGVYLNDAHLNPTNKNGQSTFLTSVRQNQIHLLFDTLLYKNCAEDYEVIYENSSVEAKIDIPLQIIRYCPKPEIFLSTPLLRRCFDNHYYGNICNEGTQALLDSQIEITLDSFFVFQSASLPFVQSGTQKITLRPGDIQVGECTSFNIKFTLSCDAEIGTEHCIEADLRFSNDSCITVFPFPSYKECRQNIGSYDPNDKTVFVDGVQSQSYVEPGDKVEYVIRFQNTGTDTAFTVRIEDYISESFDLSSIKPEVASHPYHWSLEGRFLVVTFDDIRLVDSFQNEPESHGFVKFSIALADHVKAGDQFSNQAAIYFDLNEPVITNEVTTRFGKPSSTKDFQKVNDCLIIPNPSDHFIKVKTPGFHPGPRQISFLNMQGQALFSSEIKGEDELIYIQHLMEGSYIVVMTQGGKKAFGKLVRL